MYFIEHLCDIAQRENHPEFVRMVERDILRVVDAVAPADGSGANVKVVRNVRSGPDLTKLQMLTAIRSSTAYSKKPFYSHKPCRSSRKS